MVLRQRIEGECRVGCVCVCGGGGGGEEEFNTFLIWRTRGFDWGEVIGLRDIVAINQTNICTRYSKQPTLC